MLRTLGFRIPEAHVDRVLGQVAVYPWDASFADAWQRLPKSPRRGARPPASPPYRQLLTGLTAVHNRPVRVVEEWRLSQDDKDNRLKGMIVTSEPIDPFHLSTCVRTFERLLRNGEDRNSLAPVLPTANTSRRFRDHLTVAEPGTASAPGWLFDCATWAVVAALAARPLSLEDGGPRLSLRMDTDGSLLAWDDLVNNQWNQRTGYAMLRITARIVTLPRVPDLAVTFDAHLSRINDQWRGSKTAWIDRDKPHLPLLRVPVRNIPPPDDNGSWTTQVANHATAIAEACGMEGLRLDQDLPAVPGRVRPLVPAPRMHPVGKGPGARVMLRLAEHIAATCPELEPLRWERDTQARVPEPRRQVLGLGIRDKHTVTVTPETVESVARASGHKRFRIMCLYATSEARERMATQLRTISETAAPTLDDTTVEGNSALAVSFHHVPDLLRHGTHDRSELLQALETTIAQEAGPLLGWLETEFDPRTGKPKDDAKNPLRRHLARLGITTQFLSTPPPLKNADSETVGDRPRRPVRRRRDNAGRAEADHPARSAAADLLLRAAGILHPEMTAGILQGQLDRAGLSSVHLVGLHCRLQQSGTEGIPPKLVRTATALRAHVDPSLPWTVTMWSENAAAWTSYPHAIAEFHANPIGSPDYGRSGEKVRNTRFYTESCLDALPPGPAIIIVDALATRLIWPGLQNHRFGIDALPGANLSAQRDVAVVRCNTSREVPRPVHRQGGIQPRDHRQPAAPDRFVYHLAESCLWLLPKSSRAYRAKGGRLGAQYTPWTLPDELGHLIQDDWHSYTGTEIAVPQTGPWEERELVTLTARLCDHTVIWDDRTLAPIPLHLASRADQTHPEYRTDEDDENI